MWTNIILKCNITYRVECGVNCPDMIYAEILHNRWWDDIYDIHRFDTT